MNTESTLISFVITCVIASGTLAGIAMNVRLDGVRACDLGTVHLVPARRRERKKVRLRLGLRREAGTALLLGGRRRCRRGCCGRKTVGKECDHGCGLGRGCVIDQCLLGEHDLRVQSGVSKSFCKRVRKLT